MLSRGSTDRARRARWRRGEAIELNVEFLRIRAQAYGSEGTEFRTPTITAIRKKRSKRKKKKMKREEKKEGEKKEKKRKSQ